MTLPARADCGWWRCGRDWEGETACSISVWTAIAVGGLYWLSNRFLPDSMTIFRAMGEGSPLLAHTVPWTSMLCALALAGALFCAALQIVQRRGY